MKFCARRGMLVPKSGISAKLGPEKGSYSSRPEAVPADQVGLPGQGMIEADVEPVIAIAKNRRRNVVFLAHLGEWIEARNRFSDGVHSIRGNPAILEWLLSEGIQRVRENALRKVAGSLEGGGHIGDLSDSLALPAPS